MHRLSSRWLVALFAALVLALAACEADEEEPEEPADPTEEPDEGDPDDADEDAEDEVAEDADAEDADAEDADEEEADLTPADGETIVDLLNDRAEAPEVDEDAEEPAEPSYATLLETVETADLVELLDSEGPFTVFAPTDDAFALQPEDTLEAIVDDPDRLAAVLGFHVVEGEVTSEDLTADDTFETVSGETLRVVENEGGDLTIQGVPIVEPDLEASNGVVHGI
ncbi:MAG: fasciclin domain-containing protein, partial [Actinomycetota bacterium]